MVSVRDFFPRNNHNNISNLSISTFLFFFHSLGSLSSQSKAQQQQWEIINNREKKNSQKGKAFNSMPVLYYINCEQNYYTEKHSRCYPNIKNFNSVNRKLEDKKKTKNIEYTGTKRNNNKKWIWITHALYTMAYGA